MAKRTGYYQKLYRQVAALSALITTTPAIGSWLEVTTVNKVDKSFAGEKTTVETRESVDDITLTSTRVSEFTVSIPVDLSDTHYLAFINASNDATTIALMFACETVLTAASANDIQTGNFLITDESSSEGKKEAVIATFKCSPSTFYKRVIDPT